MKISIYEIKTLTASEEMVLTNGKTFSSPGGTVYLGKYDSPDNWWEISLEEAKTLRPEEFEIPLEEAV